MKRLLILFLSFFIFNFVTTTQAHAATCDDLDGYCRIIIFKCANGSSIPGSSDCSLLQNCCPNSVGNPNQALGITCAENGGVNTAIGCIPVGSGNDLVNTILRLALGMGGGLALALILYGTFIVTTSAGMPDKLKAGGEIITSAIIGLIFILISVFLVHLIGINILGIPGLSL